MLNAIITANDQTAIVEFPMDIFDLHRELGKIGIHLSPHDIKLTDNEDDKIQVKLYADNDIGNHVIRLLNEKDNLEDVHTVVGAIGIAPEAIKEQLEEYLLYDQIDNKENLYDTIREMKEAIAPVVTTFYCPLTAEVYDSEYGEMFEVGYADIRAAEYEIAEALEKDQSTDFDMADFISDHPSANAKLVSAVWSVEEINGVLYGKIDCRSAEAFTAEEIEALKDGICGQNSDGLGEGFEQRPIQTDMGEMYVSFWSSGDDYFLRTQGEMDETLNQGMKMEGI